MPFSRVIPVLLLRQRSLVKSVRFRKPVYVGDPINTVRIFNEREVDELVILDITASPENRGPRFSLLEEVASEAFMPFAYGGGVRSVAEAREILGRGAEKIVLNTSSLRRPDLISELAAVFGSQSIVVSIDCKRKVFGGWSVLTNSGREKTRWTPQSWAREAERLGAGEILLTSVDQDGTFAGYDLALVQSVVECVGLPVIACGGAGSLEHVQQVITDAGASAAAAGSLFVFQGAHRAVLVNYPSRDRLDDLIA